MRLDSTARAAAAVIAAVPLLAQRDKEPKRPRMEAQADTNDPHAYYRFAMDRLKEDPNKAADALYWSTRLEPTMAEAYYARRIALLLSDRTRLSRYFSGDRRTIESKEVKQIDSLFLHALTLNPFVPQSLERQLFEGIADDIASRYERSGAASAAEVRYAIDIATKGWGTGFRAWLAYGEGSYDESLKLYAQAVKEDKRNGPLRLDRARIFGQRGMLDSALVELTAGVEDLRKRDKKDLVFVYQSKALTEHSIGSVHQQLGNLAAAKEAYGRALQEDLSYYPAHLQLAYIALEQKDTTTALNEMDLAVQLRDDDPAAQYSYGFALVVVGRANDAVPHLRKAMQLNPYYAAPKFLYARLLDLASLNEDAIEGYKAYLAAASRNDPRRPEAEARLAALVKSGPRDFQ
jgi:tetratricopeptide (TPR) repeat protein